MDTSRLNNKTPKKEGKVKRPFVYLTRVDCPELDPIRIRLPATMSQLFIEAQKSMDLKREVKQILDQNGTRYMDIDSIPPKAVLIVSCIDPDINNDNISIYKSRLPKKTKEAIYALPEIKNIKQPKPLPEDAAQHKAIAASPYTTKENIRNCLLSLFASLTPEQKAAIPHAQALQQLLLDTQRYLFEHSLLTQFIGSTSVISQNEIGQQTIQYLLGKLKGIKVEDCHFVSTGPSQSGKSTIIGMAASLFFQKLQLSGDFSDYLLFPINWVLYQIYLDDFQRFYNLFVKSTFTALKAARMELIPIIDSLMQWFLSLILIPTFPPIPANVVHTKNFPADVFVNIGRQIHDVWNSKSGLEEFFRFTASLPTLVAQGAGLKNAVYIYDHFDACNFSIEPTSRFKNSTPFELAPIIIQAIGDSPFFIASQDDTEFFKLFTIQNFKAIPSERIISFNNENQDSNSYTNKEIVISQPPIILNIKMCHGCPAYCAMFKKLVELIEMGTKMPSGKGYMPFRPVVDHSWKELLKQEISRFCLLLEPTDTEGSFDNESLNDLMRRNEIEAHLR